MTLHHRVRSSATPCCIVPEKRLTSTDTQDDSKVTRAIITGQNDMGFALPVPEGHVAGIPSADELPALLPLSLLHDLDRQ